MLLQTFAKEGYSLNISIKDIAKKCNISVSTVSRALNGKYGVNDKTREKILQAAAELGYVPSLAAQELVNQKSNLIGIIIPDSDFEARPAFFELLPHINKTLNLYGQETIITAVDPFSYQSGNLEKLIKMRNLNGCIILPGFIKNHPIFMDIRKIHFPFVVLEEPVLTKTCSNINTDEVLGGYWATKFLIENGHRKIGFMNGYPFLELSKERLEGYKKALQEAKIAIDENLIISSDFTGAGGGKSVQVLLERDSSITAVFCANDLMAMGAISVLSQKGFHVPEKLSIIGYDGLFVGQYYNPPLATIKIANQRIGIRTAELLMELINGGTGKTERIQPELYKGMSVKRISC